MNPPNIFISATSGDLSSARQIAKDALLTINCHPVEQTNFEPDWRSVTDMLRGKISDCKALIHLVGFRYGAEPDLSTLPDGTPRRSYTQMEYHLARALGLRVYTFLLPETYRFDVPAKADTAEQTQLQAAHRALIQSGPHLYEPIKNDLDLRTRITALQEKVIGLEQEQQSIAKEVTNLTTTMTAGQKELAAQLSIVTAKIERQAKEIKLEMWRPMSLRNDHPSLWLQAYNELVPMIGREAEIEELFQMINCEGSFRWRVFFGEAGMGKTRLAIEFARRAMSEGWHAGFLNSINLQSFVSGPMASAWRPCVPTLIIVDYAASKVAGLRSLFEHLAAMEAEVELDKEEIITTPSVRVLLLERHADEARGWLRELRAAGESVTGHLLSEKCYLGLKKLQPPGGKPDSGSTSADFTRQIIKNTFARWEAITGRQAPSLPDFSEKDWRSIQVRTRNRPLYLQMAAIHACERQSAVQLPAWGRGELLSSAVARERKYVEHECGGNTDLCKAVEHITAILCLAGCGAARGRQWIHAVGEELKAIGVSISPNQVEHHRRAIFSEAQAGFSEVETGIIQPDIVSEGFAAQVLEAEEDGTPSETLRQILRLSGIKAWANLVRMVQDLVGIEKHLFKSGEIDSIDSWLAPLLADRPLEELRQLIHVIPERSISLHGFALTVNEHLLHGIPKEHIFERAECLLSLGTHRCFMRNTKESLERAVNELREAIRLYSQLPLDDSQRGCRLKMSKAHRMIDRALGTNYEEAARNCIIAARLASGEPSDCLSSQLTETRFEVASLRTPNGAESMLEFANAINNLGMNLNALKRNSEALEVAQHAVEVGEQLIAHNWLLFAPDLARYLNNLSMAQSSSGDLTGAISSCRRSAQIRAEFALDNPDEFAHPLSLTLANLVALEYSQKNVAGAQAASEQLIAIYDDLSARDPASYRGELAQCYHNIGYLCDDKGNKEEGIRNTLEGLKIREELLESDFDGIALDLAWSHHNIGYMYREVSDVARAQPHLERAYALRLQWVEHTPGRQLQELVKSANNMASLCREKGDSEGEAMWLDRAVRHGQATDLPLADRAMAAHNLAEALGRLGRSSEAAAAAKSAAQGFREKFGAISPETDVSSWADAGCNLASALALYGDWGADETALLQAIGISEQVLERINGDDTGTSFVWGALMNNLGHAQFRQGEMQRRLDGVRQGLENLERSVKHHIKHGNKAAAGETNLLIVRAHKALAALQGA